MSKEKSAPTRRSTRTSQPRNFLDPTAVEAQQLHDKLQKQREAKFADQGGYRCAQLGLQMRS